MRKLDRSVCVICGLRAFHPSDWFLIYEDEWRDTLTFFQWSEHLAQNFGAYPVCCPLHGIVLAVNWMTTGHAEFPSAACPPQRFRWPARQTGLPVVNLQNHPMTKDFFVGELGVDRESLTRILGGDKNALRSILEALKHSMNERLRGLSAVAEPVPANSVFRQA